MIPPLLTLFATHAQPPSDGGWGWILVIGSFVSGLLVGLGAFLARVIPVWAKWATDTTAAEADADAKRTAIKRDMYDQVYDEFKGMLEQSNREKADIRTQSQNAFTKYESNLAAQDKRIDDLHDQMREAAQLHADCLVKNERLLGKVMVMEARLETFAMMEERAALPTKSEAVIIVDTNGKIREWSPAATLMFHWARDEAVGRPVRMLIPEKDLDRWRKAIEEIIASGRPVPRGPHRLDGRTREGDIIPLELTMSSWDDRGTRVFSAAIRLLSPAASAAADKPLSELAASPASIMNAVHRVTSEIAQTETPRGPEAADDAGKSPGGADKKEGDKHGAAEQGRLPEPLPGGDGAGLPPRQPPHD